MRNTKIRVFDPVSPRSGWTVLSWVGGSLKLASKTLGWPRSLQVATYGAAALSLGSSSWRWPLQLLRDMASQGLVANVGRPRSQLLVLRVSLAILRGSSFCWNMLGVQKTDIGGMMPCYFPHMCHMFHGCAKALSLNSALAGGRFPWPRALQLAMCGASNDYVVNSALACMARSTKRAMMGCCGVGPTMVRFS